MIPVNPEKRQHLERIWYKVNVNVFYTLETYQAFFDSSSVSAETFTTSYVSSLWGGSAE